MYTPFGFNVEMSNCQICERNLLYPKEARPTCPRHPPVEVHHHHHYTTPTAPQDSGNYYPSAGSYYPPPGNYYPPSGNYYLPPGNHYPPPGGYYPTPAASYPGYNPGHGTIRSYSWVDSSLGSPLPPLAVRGGTDVDGQPIYVGKAQHERDVIPAKIIPGRKYCSVAYYGKEHAKNTYQVLCDSRAEWVPAQGGGVHPDAVEGGKTDNDETLYIGRALHLNSQTVGKIHPSHGTCYIPFDGKEIGYPHYEVLISRRHN